MTEPIQRFLEKRKVPRWGSILIIFVILIGGVYAFSALVGPPIAKQVNNLVDNAPKIANDLIHLKDVALQQKKTCHRNLRNISRVLQIRYNRLL